MYHAIGYSRFAVRPEDFKKQMAYLKAHARVVSLDEIVAGDHEEHRAPSPLTCAITFDDGYAGVHEYAYPILRQYGFGAVVYVTTSALDSVSGLGKAEIPGFFPGEPVLNWEQVREMNANGITIGSHLCHHLDLRRADVKQCLEELCESKRIICEKISTPCNHFAYPSGWFKPDTVTCVRRAGYESAVTVRYSTVADKVDRFRIPRMGVGPENSEYFEQMLLGGLDYLLITRKLRHTFGFED